MLTSNVILLISVLVDALCVSGAIGALFRFGSRISVLEATGMERAAELKTQDAYLRSISERMVRAEAVNEALEKLLPDIHLIAGMGETLKELTAAIRGVVPRTEMDARFSAVEHRIDALEKS